jgi:hypothetical protein
MVRCVMTTAAKIAKKATRNDGRLGHLENRSPSCLTENWLPLMKSPTVR